MAGELPHGTITVLFTDVEGSTDVATRKGDEPAHRMLREQRELIRAEIEHHRGHEVKTMGDGFMVVFASARDAVACSVAIQRALDTRNRAQPDRALRLRAGLNTGEAIQEEDDYFGLAVTAAARIMNKAKGGEIFISDAVRGVLGPARDVKLVDRGRVRLKGFDERWRIHEVVWQAAAPPPAPIDTGSRTPFVSRERERAQLIALLDAALTGQGTLAMLSGEAGVGKTRLAEEIVAEAQRRGMLTFVGHCYEDAGAPPYVPFVEVLETAARLIPSDALRAALGDSLPDVARLMPGLWRLFPNERPQADLLAEQEQHYLFNGVRAFLGSAANAQPLVLILDDLQWADDSTMMLLQHVARALDGMRVLIVGTYRGAEGVLSPHLVRALAEFHRQRLVRHIELAPFAETGVSALLQAMSGRPPPTSLVHSIYEETEGNPFFIEELFKELDDGDRLFSDDGAWCAEIRLDDVAVPQGVRLLIERRLTRLGDATLGVVRTAAVIGQRFDVPLLEAATGAAGEAMLDALDEAELLALIEPEGRGPDGAFRFAHDLIRHTLIGALASGQKQREHLRIARACEAVFVTTLDDHATELAYHYQAAGRIADPARAFAAARRAGDRALLMHAHPEAETHYENASRVAEHSPNAVSAADRARLLHKFAQVRCGLGQYDDSRRMFDEALAIYRSLGQQEDVAEVLFWTAMLCMIRGQFAEALDALARAKDECAGGLMRGLILQLEAQNLVQMRQYPHAGEAILEAEEIADRLGDEDLRLRVDMAAGFLDLATLELRRSVERFTRALDSPHLDLHRRMASQSRRAQGLIGIGELDRAVEDAAGAQEYFGRMQDSGPVAPFSLVAAQRDPYEYGLASAPRYAVALVQGRFDEVLEGGAATLLESGDAADAWVLFSLMPLMAQTLCQAGRFAEVAPFFERYLGSRTDGRWPRTIQLVAALADTAGTAGSTGRFDETLAHSLRHRPDIRSLSGLVLMAEIAVLRRDASLAGDEYDVLMQLHEAGMIFTPMWIALLPRLVGGLAILRGEYDTARRLLDVALQEATRTAAVAEMAMTHVELAELAASHAGGRDGRRHAAEARRLVDGIGMHGCDGRLAAVEQRMDAAPSSA